MSTRCSVYHEEDGIHIFQDLANPDADLFLEYSRGPFLVTIPLSKKLSSVIMAGLKDDPQC